ncbi:S-layer homology domain-containing protein [Thermohalobacter berrensis]|uniref:SLH domain-containing protein n=1 Tax=Thermohalobacter berrensis TaxID=99594 RepID=A0A419T806_9FIRM|nr:S-layer homology domain-containing protein [Thermohalobacter berrensis]RKD33518.1 hypothetical protein BET03_09020 [Thermohalobacter berrensis]
MFKRISKVVLLAFIAVFILGNITVYAKDFDDVSEEHWAKEYIEKVSEAGIITGYPDDTFKPNNNVTKTQALVMTARVLDIDEDEREDIEEKYETFLNNLGVEPWAKKDIAVAIEKGIVAQDFIKNLYEEGENTRNAYKAEVTVYLTRAMGLEDEAKDRIAILPFKDAELIPASVAPYIDVMIEKGIISKKGDSQGRFNPEAPMTRAMMAKVLSIAYDYVEGNISDSNDVNIEEEDIDEEDIEEISGTISDILLLNGETYITIEDEDGENTAYKTTSKSTLELDDEEVDPSELVEGLEVEAKVTDDFRIVSLTAESIEEEYSGKIKSIVDLNPHVLTLEYEEDDETETRSFRVDDDVDITLDGDDADLDDLNDGDLADIEVVNNKIVKIDAESKYKEIEGYIREIKFQPDPILVVEEEDEEDIYEYPLDEDVDIERNEKDVELTELMIGDRVDIKIEYNYITDIKAEVVESEDEGTIREIIISENPQLTILNEDREEKTYYISNVADIEVDNKDGDIYDLRLDYYVELEIESNYITSIEAEVREKNERFEGEISYIDDDAGLIVLTIKDSVSGQQTMPVYTTGSTSVVDVDGDNTRLKYLDEGDEVIVTGTSNNGVFYARVILVTQRAN